LTEHKPTILVYGYGNPGRQDDGTGVLLTEKLELWIHDNQLMQVHTDSNYQLNLEDAAAIARYDLVIFADASREDLDDFRLDTLTASEKVEFTMHALSPAFVLHLCKEIFNHEPEAYLLHIRGYEWEFMGSITEKAGHNLSAALQYIQSFILRYLGVELLT
jgi:hydrogenase maturation protease